MKTLKRISALLIAITMMVAMSAVAFADGDTDPSTGEGGGSTPAATTKTVTLSNGKAGHTYTLYQIFTGSVKTVEGEEQLTDIQWGSDASATYKAAFDTAAAAAKAIADKNDARATAQDLISKSYLGTGTAKAITADGKVEFTGLKEGYYIVVDNPGPSTVTEGDFYSAVIVAVVKDVTMNLKGSAPTSEKKVADINDSTDTTKGSYQDSADYDIGDAVPFQLKATTASTTSSYKKYHITFQDKQSTGLDAPTEWKVTVLGKEFTVGSANPDPQTTDNGTKITVTKETPATGNTFAIKVEFEPVAVGETAAATYLNEECNGTDILVQYTSTLNSSAVIGAAGNPNESYITYSNKPESNDGSEEGKTPDDKVIVFTYKTVIDKIDETGAALTGANFTLYKEVAVTTTTGAKTGAAIKATYADDVKAAATALVDAKYYVEVGNKTGDATGSTFEFKGVDDGTYVLVETTIPTGYNAWASQKFTISATHDETADTPTLKTLTGTTPFTNANATSGNVEVDKKNGTKHTAASGELYTEIENNSGAVLPETGGIGTTIFYTVGAILVLAAGVLLVTRRRMSAR